MSLLYEETGKTNERLRQATKRALDYLISDEASAVIEAPYKGGNALCAIDKRSKWCCKLGSNGLAVLAVAKYIDVVGDPDGKYLKAAQMFAGWIRAAQHKDGSFIHKQFYPSGELDPKKYCRYYPGEAIFGLTQLYKIDGDEGWIDVAAKAGQHMMKETADDPTNDHWLLYGLRELPSVRPDRDYIAHSMMLAQFLHDKHEEDVRMEDEDGAYGGVTSICSTATKMEGLCAAYELAKSSGLEEDANRIWQTWSGAQSTNSERSSDRRVSCTYLIRSRQ